jgi:hypothetical protein
MKLIQTITLGSTASTIEFTSIPQDGTDLVLLASLRSTDAGASLSTTLNINGVTTNRTSRYLEGSGSTASSSTRTSGVALYTPGTTQTSNTFSNVSLYFANYSGATNKSFSTTGVDENNGTTAYQLIQGNLWSSSAAITSLSVSGVNFATGSTISLYKITKGTDGIVVVS